MLLFSGFLHSFSLVSNPIVHQKAVNALCSLMQSHDVDVRYTDPHIKVSNRLTAQFAAYCDFKPILLQCYCLLICG